MHAILRVLVFLAAAWGMNPAAAEGFTLTDAAGKAHSLVDYRGKWVIVNFWATWCPPCLEEIPDLVSISETRQDVQVFGIAMEFQDTRQVLQFAEGMFVNYPIVLGDEKLANALGGIKGLPTTLVYDPSGALAVRHAGKLSRKQLEEMIGKGRT